MEKHILSKSTFIKGYHCLKSLYLHKKRPFLRDRFTAEQLAKFKRGHKVGDLAQQLYPGGIDVSPKSPSQYQKSAIRTGELIEQGQEVIYEATFQFNKVLIMLDLLVKTPDGWNAYEVKSSKSLSETYYTDAALQYYVMENAGLKINQFFLVYVDKNYRLEGEINLQQYFIEQDVTEDLKGRQSFIGEKIEEELLLLQEKHSPKVAVGDHCFAPYKCDFVGFCWKKMADKPYLPKSIEMAGTLKDKPEGKPEGKPDDAIGLSLIFSEQAIPECANEIAYFKKCIGFKVGDHPAEISGKSCEDKKEFLNTFFNQIENDKTYITFDLGQMKEWLEDITIQYPEYKTQIEELIKNSLGILEILEEAKLFKLSERAEYTLAYLSKDVLSRNQLSKSAIYSDILANALFDKMTTDLWGENSPDIDSLKEYLDEKNLVSLGLFEKMLVSNGLFEKM